MATPKEKADKKKPKEAVAVDAVQSDRQAAVKIASPAEAPKPAGTKSMKKGKLPPKHKSRLPRRQKKAQQKAATRL